MFVWMVAQYLPDMHMGGKEYFVYYVSKQLAKIGHQVCVITSSDSMWSSSYVDDGVKIIKMPIIHDFKSYYTPLTLSYFPGSEVKPDIIHIHEPCAVLTTLAAIFAKIKNIPLVVSYYNDPLPFGPWQAQSLGKLVDLTIQVYGMTANQMKLNWADKILILNGRQIRSSRYLYRYRDKTTVLPMGVAPKFFAQLAGRHLKKVKAFLGGGDGKTVLYVGRLDFRKGVDHLIRAIGLIKELNVRLVLIGDSNSFTFKQMAHDQGIDAIFTGNISNEMLPAWYDSADLLVLPSIHLEESFGAVILEAWTQKKPVVVSDLPGPSDIVQTAKGGLVFKRNDPDDLANAIRSVLMNKEIARTMGLNGYRFAQNYSYEKIGEQLVSIYQEVLRKRTTK